MGGSLLLLLLLMVGVVGVREGVVLLEVVDGLQLRPRVSRLRLGLGLGLLMTLDMIVRLPLHRLPASLVQRQRQPLIPATARPMIAALSLDLDRRKGVRVVVRVRARRR